MSDLLFDLLYLAAFSGLVYSLVSQAYKNGFSEGKSQWYKIGFADGENTTAGNAYNKGFIDGLNTGQSNSIDRNLGLETSAYV